MAYFTAHCDYKCKGCQMNLLGWCGFLDIPVEGYDFENRNSTTYTDENKYPKKEE